ncbi:hypothetical protein KVF89_16325 [Nocardioides carbamazepini]|uniref:hypothetical protein n=1 Tax=Nocardioides carbamazepini TaxID=2854259 RepID=UPI00214A6369|nr:hypothetical protein [Nocardioides carbamazepini]MCR1784107.1 hypothetical protein [Nocardioides carbamazepini]
MSAFNAFDWFRAVRAAIRSGQPGMVPAVMMTAFVLQDYSDYGTGERARPMASTLAWETGQDERTVRRHLGAMRDAGLIEQIRRGGGAGASARGTEWRLRIPVATADTSDLSTGTPDRTPDRTPDTGGLQIENIESTEIPHLPFSDANANARRDEGGGPGADARGRDAGTSPESELLVKAGLPVEDVAEFVAYIRTKHAVKFPEKWLRTAAERNLPEVVAEWRDERDEAASNEASAQSGRVLGYARSRGLTPYSSEPLWLEAWAVAGAVSRGTETEAEALMKIDEIVTRRKGVPTDESVVAEVDVEDHRSAGQDVDLCQLETAREDRGSIGVRGETA